MVRVVSVTFCEDKNIAVETLDSIMGRCFRYDQLLEETTGCSLTERIEDRQGENGCNQAFKWRIHLFNSYV